ncbi:MAG: YggS family pyridoxal phosphate-dependent enzyme [Planctomycetaceae bacterium]
MSNVTEVLRANLTAVTRRIHAACIRSGRPVDSVRLVAVTKMANVVWIRELVALGQTDLAENRPQQLLDRAAQLEGSIVWHQIGTLQRNKIRKVLPVADWIHSVDSLALLSDIDRIAGELNLRPNLLLQVNVSGEASKQGFEPELLFEQSDRLTAFAHVSIRGLMTMAPLVDDPESVRHVFRALREFRDRLVERSHRRLELDELSMGMSGDYEVAIEEGATMVRIGSAIFEGVN